MTSMRKINNFKIFEERVFSSTDLNQTLRYIADVKRNTLAGFLMDFLQQQSFTPDIDFIDFGKELNELTFIARNRVDYKNTEDFYSNEKRQSIRAGRLVRKLLNSISGKELNYSGVFYIATYINPNISRNPTVSHNIRLKTDILFPCAKPLDAEKSQTVTTISKLAKWSQTLPTNITTKCSLLGKGEIGYIPKDYGFGKLGDGKHLENDSLKKFNINKESTFNNVDIKTEYAGNPFTQICRHFNSNFIGINITDAITDTNDDTEESLITMSGDIKIDININFTDSNIEQFVNEFIAARKMYDFDKTGLEFKLVKGEDIRKYYLYTNYYGHIKDEKNKFIKGTLWNSCMRHSICQHYLDIYCKNSAASLLILVTPEDKIVGRALIWQLSEVNDSKIFMDRAYTIHDADVKLFNNYAIKEGWVYLSAGGSFMIDTDKYDKQLYVKLEKMYFDEYPYMDTLRYLGNKELTTDRDESYEFELNDTEGHWEGYDYGNDDEDY